MLRVRWGTLLPSVIVVSLPVIWHSATAAERVVVPDGPGSWAVTISPGAPAKTESAEPTGIVLTAYQPELDGPVPAPVEAPATQAGPAKAAVGETVGAAPAACPPMFVDAASYAAVYRSIPFLRSEYLANPSYRHEATMEILFGQLRPTVIHKEQPGRTVPSLSEAAPPPAAFPWVYDPYFGQIPTFFRNYAPTTFPLLY